MAKKDKNKSFDSIVKGLKEESYSNPNIESLNSNPSTDYPLFGFKYLKDDTHKDCKKSKFFIDFLDRLKKLSNLSWKEIEKSGRHKFGTEGIELGYFKPDIKLPPQFSNKKKLTVFRATGDKHVFAGIREGNTFHIMYIESEFGDLYDHD